MDIIKEIEKLSKKANKCDECLNYRSIKKKRRGGREKAVFMLHPNGDIKKEYQSMGEAEEKTGISRVSISMVCNGHRERAGGFKWKFKDHRYNIHPILQISKDGEIINEFTNAAQASEAVKIKISDLKAACRNNSTLNGFIWQFK